MLHKIRELAKEKGLHLYEVEQQAGLPAKSIFRWDDSMPAADKLARVAQVLGTTVEELLQAREEASDGEPV